MPQSAAETVVFRRLNARGFERQPDHSGSVSGSRFRLRFLVPLTIAISDSKPFLLLQDYFAIKCNTLKSLSLFGRNCRK